MTLVLVITTVANRGDAERLASELLQASLAACIQIDGPIRSHYRWEDKECRDDEFRLMIKTTSSTWDAIRDTIAQHHPYDEPELIRIPIDAASEGYRSWVTQSVMPPTDRPTD